MMSLKTLHGICPKKTINKIQSKTIESAIKTSHVEQINKYETAKTLATKRMH